MKVIRGALVCTKGDKIAANLYMLKLETLQEGEALVATNSPSERCVMSWHRKLGHMSKKGMKILVGKNLLPGHTWVTLLFCEQCIVSN